MIDVKLLEDLERLPIPHFAFCHGKAAMGNLDLRPFMRAEAKLLGQITVKVDDVADDNLAWAIQTCIDEGVQLGLACNPYALRKWGTPVPADAKPTDHDDVFYPELSMLRARCDFIAGRIRRAAEGAKTIIDVGTILLDCERWKGLPGTSPEMNDALDRRYNDIYRMFKNYFPATPVEWYARNLRSGLFTGREKGDSYSSVAYHTPEPWVMSKIRQLDRIAALVTERKGLWISLDACYRTGPDGKKVFDWSGYAPGLSRNLAHYVKQWGPAYVVLWPAYSHPAYVTEGKQSADDALLHLIEYVKGFGDA